MKKNAAAFFFYATSDHMAHDQHRICLNGMGNEPYEGDFWQKLTIYDNIQV